MTDNAQARKLATIVALDVVGYSARTEADEAKTTAEVVALRKVIEGIAARHGGRVFNTAGDGFMLEFGSSLAAVEAALALAETCKPKVRVGVHLGDVVVQPNGDLLGHGVNVAARLMAQSAPGAALVSGAVRQTIRGPIAERLHSRGTFKLDKMAETVEAFALVGSAVFDVAQRHSTEPLLAVLPFDNLSNDPEMQFFSDGVADEILQVLMQHTGLKVIGRTSAFQFRGAAKASAARELKASHVLDGAVRKSGTRMRVTTQLTDAATGTALWGERFDRDVADVFALQDDIAAKVARALQQTLARERLPQRIDPVAYELYLRARPLGTEWGEGKTRQAIALLEQVVAREPNLAAAWALLAAARGLLLPATRDVIGEPDHDAALAAAHRALAIDPKCVEAYRALALLKPAFAEHGEKVRLMETALVYAPNDPIIVHSATIALLTVGRCRELLDIAERMARAEPMSAFHAGIRAAQLCDVGRVDEAIEAIEDAWRRWPDAGSVWSFRWLILLVNGRADEAARMCAPDAPVPRDISGNTVAFVRQMQALLSLDREARLQHLEAALNVDQSALSLRMCSYVAFAGHPDLAFKRLFAALDAGTPITNFSTTLVAGGVARAYALSSLFGFLASALRRDRRFPRVCARFGLVDYWRESGKWPDCVEEVAAHYDFKAECVKALRENATA